jgi:hypothetical protein
MSTCKLIKQVKVSAHSWRAAGRSALTSSSLMNEGNHAFRDDGYTFHLIGFASLGKGKGDSPGKLQATSGARLAYTSGVLQPSCMGVQGPVSISRT